MVMPHDYHQYRLSHCTRPRIMPEGTGGNYRSLSPLLSSNGTTSGTTFVSTYRTPPAFLDDNDGDSEVNRLREENRRLKKATLSLTLNYYVPPPQSQHPPPPQANTKPSAPRLEHMASILNLQDYFKLQKL